GSARVRRSWRSWCTRADPPDEGQWDQEAEQREARDRLQHVGEPEHGPAPGRPPREQDAARNTHRQRDARRDGDQVEMLADEGQGLAGVMRVELEEAHAII